MISDNTWERIDEACDDYLSKWTVEKRPPIESYLRRVPPDSQHDMAVELVLVDIECHQSAGLEAAPEAYAKLPAEAVEEAFRRIAEERDKPAPWVLDALQSCSALHGLRGDCLNDLAKLLEVQELSRGDLLIREGAPSQGLYIILKGVAEIRTKDDGKRTRVIDRSGAGAVLGEMSLLTGAPCTADVAALEDLRTLVLSQDHYETLCGEHEELEIVMGVLVADRLGSRDWDALCGKRLHDFQIDRCLRRGGMGVVYEATHEDHAGPVALKMLRHSLIHDEQAVERFKQEGHLLKSLHHPNIIAVHEIFFAYRTVFLAMELCDGEDLGSLQDPPKPLPEALVRRVLGQIAAGLHFAQQQRIVHLDLKPTNVLINRHGVAKLCDFGLAEILDSGGPSRTGALAGTPSYMAPEQLSAMDVGPESDWYAFGCLAYEMLAGQPLFGEMDLLQLSSEKANWAPPREWPLNISDEMKDLLTLTLQPLPEQRELDMRAISEWAAPVPEFFQRI